MERVTIAGEAVELTDAQAAEYWRLREAGFGELLALEIAAFEAGDLEPPLEPVLEPGPGEL